MVLGVFTQLQLAADSVISPAAIAAVLGVSRQALNSLVNGNAVDTVRVDDNDPKHRYG